MNKLFSATAAALLAISSVLPAQAGSHQDALKLMKLVEATGTKVSINKNSFDESCAGIHGYYQYIENKSDVLVICADQTNVEQHGCDGEFAVHKRQRDEAWNRTKHRP